MASFQPSLEKTPLLNCLNMDVAGDMGAKLLEISYIANVREMASLMTSVRKTAVEGKYRWSPSGGIIRE